MSNIISHLTTWLSNLSANNRYVTNIISHLTIDHIWSANDRYVSNI